MCDVQAERKAAALRLPSCPAVTLNNNRAVAGRGRRRARDRTTNLLVVILTLFLLSELPLGLLGTISAILGKQFFVNCYIPVGELMDMLVSDATLAPAGTFCCSHLYCIEISLFAGNHKINQECQTCWPNERETSCIMSSCPARCFLWYTLGSFWLCQISQSPLLHCLLAGADQQLRQLPALLRDVVPVPGELAVGAVVREQGRGAGALHTRRQQGLQYQQGRGTRIETEFNFPLSIFSCVCGNTK